MENPPPTGCEQSTKTALDKLVPMFTKNHFEELETILASVDNDCGESEFTLRLRILRALLEQKETLPLINSYYAKNYPEVLIMRWDYSVEQKRAEIYHNNKADFNFVPLRHAIDSLVQLKSQALLQSPTFNLKPEEKQITLLFADRINEFSDLFEKNNNTALPRRKTSPLNMSFVDKERSGVSIYAGAETSIGGSRPIFRTNPTFGLMFSSRLSSDFLYEIGAKVRINSNDRDFDYLLYGRTETINSSASYSFGGSLGYKLYDNNDWIFYPKVGIYWESTATGLSEVIDSDNWWGNEYYNSSSIKFHNVNTMRSSLGFATMRHIKGKQYIGLEASYHYIPYNWDNSLLTNIQPNYASLQLFYRF
ncbi:hypothetical protein [Sphingobacterium sp. MYb382]|uniref:hypothetical protein n=1 Tax=Sphingobacterium sp. MYb382 TaxID=2745278 RepID=UPI0030B09E5F